MGRLWWQGVRRRPLVNALLVLVSAIAVALAASGPVLVRAVEESATASTLDDAGAAGRAVVLSSELSYDDTYPDAVSTVSRALTFDAPGRPALWTAPEVSFVSDLAVDWRGAGPTQSSRLLAAESACAALVLTAGRCPAADGEVVLPTSTARTDRAAQGGQIRFPAQTGGTTRLTVVGRYDPGRSSGAPLVRPAAAGGIPTGVSADPLVVTVPALNAQFGSTAKVVGRIEAQPNLRYDDVALLSRDLANLVVRLASTDIVLGLDSDLPTRIDRLVAQLRDARVVISISALEGVLLGLFALATTAQQIARVRTAEWSVGRLQGVGRFRRWTAVYAETAGALLLGVPLGLLLLRFAASLVVRATLRAGTSVAVFRPAVLLAGAGAGVASLVILVLVSGPRLRRPLADAVQQDTEAARLGRVAAVVQAVVVVLALVTAYQLAAGSQLGAAATPLGLVAPALCALATALLVVQAATALVRRSTAKRARGVSGLVVGRRMARVPSVLQPSLVVVVGVSLAVLSGQVAGLSARNQELKADATLGAAAVLQVEGAADASALQAAVAKADPTARAAMAAVELDTGASGSTSRIVAVDTDRFDAVTTWRREWSDVADLHVALRSGSADPMVLRGTRVSVTVATRTLTAGDQPRGATSAAGPPVTLLITVQLPDRWMVLVLGVLARGDTQRFDTELPEACRQGCRLVSWGVRAPKEVSYATQFRIEQLRTDAMPSATSDGWLRDASRWRPAAEQLTSDSVGQAIPVADDRGLSISSVSSSGGPPQIVRSADAVDPLPALLARGTEASTVPGDPSLVYGTGLDGRAQILKPVGTAAILPRALDDGVLVDLHSLAGLSDPAQSQARSEVWLSSAAPPDIEPALTRAGLKVVSRQDLGSVRAELLAQPMTRGAVVAAAVGWGALPLALLTVVAGRLVDAERRRADWAAIRRAGLPARRVRWLAALEIGAPALLAVLLGAAAGTGLLWLSAGQLPLVDLATAGPPLDLRPAWLFLLSLGGGCVAVVVATTGLLAWRETRRGTR